MSLATSVATLFELLDVAAYFHREGWVHRDIKPDNIVLRNGDTRRPVLVDFGLGYKDGLLKTFETEHGQEIGNRFLRLPELSSGSLVKQDVRTDIAFLGGILYYMLTGASPDTLLDADGRMPHQRPQVVAKLHASAELATTSLLGLFDRCFAYKLADRYSSVEEFRREAEAMISNHEEDGDTATGADLMESILAKVNTQANQRIAELKGVYDGAMNQILVVHREILREVGPTFVSFQSGHVSFIDGLRNRLGFSHFASQEQKFAPEFLIKSLGEELVVYLDGEVLYRTDVNAPIFDEAFRRKVREVFLKGLNALLSR